MNQIKKLCWRKISLNPASHEKRISQVSGDIVCGRSHRLLIAQKSACACSSATNGMPLAIYGNSENLDRTKAGIQSDPSP